MRSRLHTQAVKRSRTDGSEPRRDDGRMPDDLLQSRRASPRSIHRHANVWRI